MATDNKIPTLDNLNDYQKSLLIKLSYVDFNTEQFKELKEKGSNVTIADLNSLLSNPDDPYLGGMHVVGDSIQLTNLTDIAVNVDTSNKEVIQELIDAGLGNLNIVDIVDNQKNGFQAICFSDSLNNKGFSYRGTDVKSLDGLLSDVVADFDSVLNNTSYQAPEANKFFEKYSNSNGKNYLYGHSLGGFLAEDVFVNHYENIENTFVINPLDINQEKLNTKEKIDAFNNPEKLSYYAIGGDLANTFSSSSLYENNIKYIKNNNSYNNELRNHLIESASFDKNNNFITTTKEESYKGYEVSDFSKAVVTVANDNKLRPLIRNIFNAFKNIFTNIKNTFSNIVNNIKDAFNTNNFIKNDINNNNNNLNIDNTNLNNSRFRDSLNPENYINDTTYTRADYENSKAFLENPMSYINSSQTSQRSTESIGR